MLPFDSINPRINKNKQILPHTPNTSKQHKQIANNKTNNINQSHEVQTLKKRTQRFGGLRGDKGSELANSSPLVPPCSNTLGISWILLEFGNLVTCII